MTRRKYHFIGYLGLSKQLSIYYYTNSKTEIEWRGQQCKVEGYPYKIINRLTGKLVDEWEPEGTTCNNKQ